MRALGSVMVTHRRQRGGNVVETSCADPRSSREFGDESTVSTHRPVVPRWNRNGHVTFGVFLGIAVLIVAAGLWFSSAERHQRSRQFRLQQRFEELQQRAVVHTHWNADSDEP